MKLDVIEKGDNPFLKRTDLILMVDHKGQSTPKKEDLEKDIASQFKSVLEKVEIVYILSEKGLTKARIKARIWEEKIIEKKKKETPAEEKVEKPEEKKEEAKPEEVKEKSAENKPEEKPKEEKKEDEKK